MPVAALKAFLEANDVSYETIPHDETYTAQQTAESTHMSGDLIAKTVIVKLDGKIAMAVVPGTEHVVLGRLADHCGARDAELATEHEFGALFPGCELGAMPPFGNLYGIDVFVSGSIARGEKITFNAGTHTELMRIAYQEYERLVRPKVMAIAAHD